MHVVITCRETEKLKRVGGDFVSDGLKPDCGKGLPYAFDIVLRLFREDGKFMADVEKDRTESLQNEGPFEVDFKALCVCLNIPHVVSKPQLKHKKLGEKKNGQN